MINVRAHNLSTYITGAHVLTAYSRRPRDRKFQHGGGGFTEAASFIHTMINIDLYRTNTQPWSWERAPGIYHPDSAIIAEGHAFLSAANKLFITLRESSLRLKTTPLVYYTLTSHEIYSFIFRHLPVLAFFLRIVKKKTNCEPLAVSCDEGDGIREGFRKTGSRKAKMKRMEVAPMLFDMWQEDNCVWWTNKTLSAWYSFLK